MSEEVQNGLRIVRMLMDLGRSLDDALGNSEVAEVARDDIRATIEGERNIILEDPRVLVSRTREHTNWLVEQDRSTWYYWPRLREYLIDTRGWPSHVVRSIDGATDRILAEMEEPTKDAFDTRGLVLGYVQSGKTANFTALIAKAVDVGYRLVIVLSGVHNTLRRQTQLRLDKQLVGYAEPRPGSIALPPRGKQWFTFTTEQLQGDFDPGNANYAALQGTAPVLIVAKKNGHVLRHLQQWLDSAPEEIRRTLPVLIIDDEADQASINIGGNRSDVDDEDPGTDDDTPPAVINGLIRGLVRRFSRSAYVGYTATPFANILIPHNVLDREVGEDLYPKDFIVDLPKPVGYFGPEEIFGRSDGVTEVERDGLDVIRIIPDEDLRVLIPGNAREAETFEPAIPLSLERAMIDFILAGAARSQRGDGGEAAAMLIHTHMRVVVQQRLARAVEAKLGELKDEWRYQREFGIRTRLEARWSEEFRPLIRSLHGERDVPFDAIVEHIGPFLESIELKQINSDTEDELDYERDPDLKTIVIGGNRLSRGLTLEGLLVSYYVRSSVMYDTLLQMGRWFGFREGYEDLTRIYTTGALATAFSDLATVEHQLRMDIRVYESTGVTPLDIGPRILRHPAMLVTSRLKARFATERPVEEQSYAGHILQTTIFPFDDREFLGNNIEVIRAVVSGLEAPSEVTRGGERLWRNIPGETVVDLLRRYRVHEEAQMGPFPSDIIAAYIVRQLAQGELTQWTVAIMGRATYAEYLGSIDLGVAGGGEINMIERTRLVRRPNSVGVLTSPGDEAIDLTEEQRLLAEELIRTERLPKEIAIRTARPESNGLLMIYPVSRNSGHSARGTGGSRLPLYDQPATGMDVMGIALSFPTSQSAVPVRGVFANGVQGTYVTGTVAWRAIR